nr:hypothetical protein 25 [Bacillales bacterium]
MPTVTFMNYWKRKQKGGRGTQSITINEFDVHAYQIEGGQVPVDYLSIVNEVWKLEVA